MSEAASITSRLRTLTSKSHDQYLQAVELHQLRINQAKQKINQITDTFVNYEPRPNGDRPSSSTET